MFKRLTLAIVFGLLLPTGLLASESVQKWQIDGVERQGLIFAPESAKSDPTPLLFAFHGHGGNMRQAAVSFGYQVLWPEAIVIYLQGLPTPGQLTDADGKKPGWQAHAGDENNRDLKLFDAALDWAKKAYNVDDQRIYSAGHSNGGGFTYLLWAERADVLAAVAPASAAPGPQNRQKLTPKPMLAIAGTKDPLVLFKWQKATIDAVRKLNGCAPAGKPQGEHITLYPSASGTPVETFLYDGGHLPPPEAWAEVVKFFKEHPRK